MDLLQRAGLVVALWLTYHILLGAYNAFFHPLHRFPGPRLAAATQLVNVYYIIRGINCKYLYELHEKYGDVVRTGPNELSFRTASAIRTIYGGNPGPDDTFHKNMIANIQETGESDNLFFATGQKHNRYRKLITPVFAERTIQGQGPMMQEYCSQLIQGLRNRCGKGYFPTQDGVVDIVPWTQFIISDILSHMLFGSGMNCLLNGDYHPWVVAGYKALIESTYIEAAHRLRPYHRILEYLLVPTRLRDGFRVHSAVSREMLQASKEAEPYQFSFPSFVSKSLSEQELFDNINVIATAAGETTSSALSAIMYYLTANPAAYDKVVVEVRQAFSNEAEITATSSASLPYLKAVIREAFRVRPTIPVGLHRLTPKGGKEIDGKWVPAGTWISVANLATCRTSSHWKDADRFIPERWLGDPEFASDNRDTSVPYSIGVRNCVGMSHANSQLRLILSYLLWNFDFEACPGNVDPYDCLEYGTWQVEPLKLRLVDFRGQST
ncbi:Cytochrome P450 monooxygenase lnbC [Cladobotryum mycophilum]|uniref:Cytochrome P450 monooxygenase lnbC n=1 Tax=Cladobotryum mycophilum TaxID=491253 RepID=A0ABR0SER8_9HYPO